MSIPAELILRDHCLDAGCIGFSEDAGCIGFSEDAGCIGFSEDAGCIGFSEDAGCIGFSEDAGCIGFSEDAGCIGFSEDAGIGATVFPPDVKYLSEATLMECLQGLQVTSVSNPNLTPV